jgi:GNAT superfamily N-acetyltransferase
VSGPGITFQLLDGRQAAAHADELLALHAEVYADPPYRLAGDAARFAERFRVQRRQPGFVLAEARHGGYLVGYAAGMPLRPSTSWWRELTTPLAADVTTEHPGRTFALTELLVRASWRRQGIAAALHDLILAGRPEERATLTVLPGAVPAQNAFAKWGWRKVARTRDSRPGAPVSDVLVTALPAARSLPRRIGLELAQDAGQVGAVRRAEAAEDPPGFGRAGRADRVEGGGAVLGHLDQGGAPVAGIGAAPDQVPGLEGVDDLGGRAGRDVQVVGEFREPHRPVPLQRAQGAQVSRGDVPGRQRLLGQLAEPARDRPEGFGQRLVAVRVAPGRRVAVVGHGNSLPPFSVVSSY